MIEIINMVFITISLIAGLLSIYFGIKITRRCSGNLKFTVIFLTIALTILFVHQVSLTMAVTGNIVGFDISKTNTETITNIFHTSAIIMILFAFLQLNKIVSKA